MPSIKDYNKKIQSFKNTRKITKTMKMVAASKLRRANQAQATAREYSKRLSHILSHLVGEDNLIHPLAMPKDKEQNVLIVLLTSDRGLCGGFNNNLIKYVDRWINENTADKNVSFSFCGRRGYNAFRQKYSVEQYYEGITAKPNPSEAAQVAKDLEQNYIEGKYDAVYIAYNYFRSAMAQEPRIEKLMPLSIDHLSDEQQDQHVDYLYEPSKPNLMNVLVPQFIQFQLFYTLLENAAGEHGARMTAMDNATRNTSDLIDKNTLLRNRARQAAITTELIEIISGAEALKG